MNVPLWFADPFFWSLQVTVLVAAAALLVKILQVHEPLARLACWRTLMAGSLLLPFVEPWQRPDALEATPVTPDSSISTLTQTTNALVSHSRIPSWAAIAELLGLLIAAGIAVRFALFALGMLKLRQLRRESATIAADGACAATLEKAQALVGKRAQFLLCREVESPVTFGFAAPVVLLPEEFLQLDERFQVAIACHELVHVRRRDWAHHLVEEVLRVIFWFHPAILWLVGRVRLAREQVVDLQVVNLTAARKAYMQALLEFTSGRKVAVIPAPPFLAEQQLVERVALMLKEANMSRRRLIASLTMIGCGLAGAAILAASVFPLKAAARAQEAKAASEAVLAADTIWTDTVKRGNMYVEVRGLGTLALLNGDPVAKIYLPDTQAVDVRSGESAQVDTHKGILKGHVIQISPAADAGTQNALIALDSPVPSGVDANAEVEATIRVATLENVVYVGRPVYTRIGSQGRTAGVLYKVTENGGEADRIQVEFGRVSVNAIQVLSGLKPGDVVILSDMSPYEKFERVEIKRAK
jgi:beta-lactamase regulating signal transducer with metallopeptidase domain